MEGARRGETQRPNTSGANTDYPNSGIPPALILAGANAYMLWNEHWEHWSHMPPLEERVEYPYQNIRTKNFQWGDGDKVR
jgi:cytochrome c oxidase subunit 6a